jgi:hypothetical protein
VWCESLSSHVMLDRDGLQSGKRLQQIVLLVREDHA